MTCSSSYQSRKLIAENVSKAEVHILDARHFALDTAAEAIAALGSRSFFGRDIEQKITLRNVEALGDVAGRIRAREKEATSITEASALDSSARNQR